MHDLTRTAYTIAPLRAFMLTLLLLTPPAIAQTKEPLQTSPDTPPVSTTDENAPVVLMRKSPRISEIEFEVMVGSQGSVNQNGSVLWQLGPTTFSLPLIQKGTSADLDPSFGGARVWFEGKEVPAAKLSIVMQPSVAGATKVDIGIPSTNCTSIRVNIRALMQLWKIEIDEAAARKIAWPREWPEVVRPFLAEDDFIHPSDPMSYERVEAVHYTVASRACQGSIPVFCKFSAIDRPGGACSLWSPC